MKINSKAKYGLIALVAALLISSSARRSSYVEMSLQDPSEVVTTEKLDSDQLQGVWRHVIDEHTDQTIQIRGNSLIITDPINGSVFYSIDSIDQVNEEQIDEDLPQDIQEYTISWSLDDYVDRYGDEDYKNPEEVEPFHCYYDPQADILYSTKDVAYYRDDVHEMLIIYKDNLCDSEPINEAQLSEFSDDELIDYILTIQEEGYKQEEGYHELYLRLAADPKGDKLLTGKDYEEYMQIVKEIVRTTTLTLSEINEANPSTVLSWYRTALAEFEGKRSREIISHIESRIHGARQDYLNQKIEGQNSLRKK